MSSSDSLKSLIYEPRGDGPSLQVLDQLLLPHQMVYIPIHNLQDAWQVIRSMQIRGAPLIAIVACLGLVVDLYSPSVQQEMAALDDATEAVAAYLQPKLDYLATSRPTAVNLFHALTEIKNLIHSEGSMVQKSRKDHVVTSIQAYAQNVLIRDLQDNQAIGKFGAETILQTTAMTEKLRVMTICNTGSLATSGYGTALGVVRALHELQRLEEVVALETRPYNQGSRLTAFEITQDELPGRLICDGMSGSYVRNHAVHAVVVGADRVCANGDTANKIGTYTLSVVAAAHGIPFYVAAPFTTLDVSLPSGNDVEIEERTAQELIDSSQAPKEIAVWNPGFDITPAANIRGIITEKGVIVKDETTGLFDVAGFVKQHTTSK